MNTIHPTAILGKNVSLGDGNEIGPYVIIEDHVKIGSRNHIYPRAYLAAGTEIADENEIHMGAVIGHVPQDLAYKKGLTSYTRIGSRNVIREYATIHRGTTEGSATVLGNGNFLMANTHVAHNCRLGNHIIMVNYASLSGYCVVEDQAFLSGMVGFHQFTRVGRLAIVSALSAINKDVPPFVMCGGRPARAQGLNAVGLRRARISAEARSELKEAFRLLYRSGLSVPNALESIEKSVRSPEVLHMIAFIRASERGIIAAASGRRNEAAGTTGLGQPALGVLPPDLDEPLEAM